MAGEADPARRLRGRLRPPADGRRDQAPDRRGHPAVHAAARALRARRSLLGIRSVQPTCSTASDVPTCLVDNWQDYQLPAARSTITRSSRRRARRRTGSCCAPAHTPVRATSTPDATSRCRSPGSTRTSGACPAVCPTSRSRSTVHGRRPRPRVTSRRGRRPHTPTAWYLHAGRRALDRAAHGDAARTARRRVPLRPSDPTPSVGGIGHAHRRHRSTTASSRRAPTCSCTRATCSTTCSRSSGPCTPSLHVSSSLDHTDFFVRLCDVYPDGSRMNVCDGLQRFRRRHRAP